MQMLQRVIREKTGKIEGFPVALAWRTLRTVLIIGLAIRLVVALTTVWPDNEAFLLLALRTAISPGAGAPFDNIYPVTWITTISLPLSVIARLWAPSNLVTALPAGAYDLTAIGLNLTAVPNPLILLVLKLPVIIGDVFAGMLIYSVVRGLATDKKAGIAFALWFLNPMVIIESSLFGQYDTLVGFFSLLAVSMIIRHRYWGAGIAFAIGFLLKPLNLFLGVSLCIYLLWLGIKNSLSHRHASGEESGQASYWWTALVPVAKFGVGCLLPLLAFLPGSNLLGVGQSASTRLTFPTLGGLNFWLIGIVPLQIAQSVFVWGHIHFIIVLLGSILLGLAAISLFTLVTIHQHGESPQGIYLLSQIALLMYPLLTPLSGAHYYIPFMAFLILGVTLSGISMRWFWLLSVSLAGWALSVWGPVFIWLPLSTGWNLLPAEPMLRWTIEYISQLRWHGFSVFLAFRFILTSISLIGVLSIFIVSLNRLYRASSFKILDG